MCLEDDRVFGKDTGQIVEKPCVRDLSGNVSGHAVMQSCSFHNASENCGKIDNYFKKCIIQKMTQQESGKLTRSTTII